MKDWDSKGFINYIFFRTKSNFLNTKHHVPIPGPSDIWTEQENGILQFESEDSVIFSNTAIGNSDELEPQEEESQVLNIQVQQDPSTSGTSTPVLSSSKLRKEKNIKRKREIEDQPVNNLVETCSTIGQNLNMFLRQSALDASQENKEDELFGASLAQSLSQIKNGKMKMILKSKILLLVSEELED